MFIKMENRWMVEQEFVNIDVNFPFNNIMLLKEADAS